MLTGIKQNYLNCTNKIIIVSCGHDSLNHGHMDIRKANGSTFIGSGTSIDCVKDISIGKNVLISYGCKLADGGNPSIRKSDIFDWRNNHRRNSLVGSVMGCNPARVMCNFDSDER